MIRLLFPNVNETAGMNDEDKRLEITYNKGKPQNRELSYMNIKGRIQNENLRYTADLQIPQNDVQHNTNENS